jgi:hypothetical protein
MNTSIEDDGIQPIVIGHKPDTSVQRVPSTNDHES